MADQELDAPRVIVRGPSFLTLLGLLFIGLKLGEVISWSWPLVLLPLLWWVYLAAAVLAASAIVAAGFGLAAWGSKLLKKGRRDE